MIICSATGCPSSQTIKIDGRPISFYPFPEDDLRKNQWIHNCNLASGVNDNEPMHLCELHFERINFTASRDLKSSAVPTLFGRIKEPSRKHKADSASQILLPKILPKQKKLDEQSYVTAMSSENTSLQHMTENSVSNNKADMSNNNVTAVNGSAASTTTGENCEKNKEIYRLTIQIDKIRGKPGPRCKKLVPPLLKSNDMKDFSTGNEKEKIQLLQSPTKKACALGSCKLRKCVCNSKLAFQCEICNKYYVTKKEVSPDDVDNFIHHSNSLGLQCLSNVYQEAKKHFLCDICQTESNTQLMYDKHVRCHVSTDPSYPYKCHLCARIFELKEDVKQHYLNDHPRLKILNTLRQITSSTKVTAQQNDHLCPSCNVSFSNEQAYRNHMYSHKKKESLRANIKETNNIIPVPNPLTGQIGILQPVKFSCNVCFKEFDNVGEVDIHTRTHLKQNLSRAYPCPICSKAFINKTTLKIHQKTHGET
ncbi:PREDICTED: zinc finger protein 90-like [Dinoponera quadriceps]|uniref:Zinc finger protein 90-like n=1 Tax=Dinoponera quadriceps TaxID=609295 RepID=A0A6P3WTM2_DINQU|nr:PREDICTED: zinc finger protein 90-like [Dinoponera quadriceps]XP_014469496.1 PREDICTED: zinc finger protein 90-like [Dinoponera quadriceps]